MKRPLPLFLACAVASSSFAAAPRTSDKLLNFDARPGWRAAPEQLTGERQTAAAELKRRIPGVQIDLEPVTGAPAWIRNDAGFLTGPGGEDELLQHHAAGINQRLTEQPELNRRIKNFVDSYSALFGHGSAVLDGAQVSREFITAHNEMRTIVWEQQLDGIVVFGGVLYGHISRNGELVCLSLAGSVPGSVPSNDNVSAGAGLTGMTCWGRRDSSSTSWDS